MHALKGHGTENDFVIIPDLDGAYELSEAAVRAICDRRAGVGADGILRVVRSAKHPEAVDQAVDAEFFMDYRNADGSVAEMCGNGVRVFLRYLHRVGLVEQEAAVATRGGTVHARLRADGDISVRMGQPEVLADRPVVTAAHDSARTSLVALTIPNPHVVVRLDSPDELAELDLTRPPAVAPELPHGQNVEFIVGLGPRHLRMRVFERGVGETRSCGTGICAVAVAAAVEAGSGADDEPWRVDVPGGTCTVIWHLDGTVELTGPAVIVAELELDDVLLGGS
jgi:diaminopimelate epimerase